MQDEISVKYYEYFGKDIRCLAVLSQPIRSDEEIPKCAEIRSKFLKS